MASKTKKTVLFSILGMLLVAAFIGYTKYNKKHFSVTNATPSAKISATELHKTFSSNTTLASNEFIGDEVNHKVIQVTGEVNEIKKDQQGSTILLLKTGIDGAYINCTLELLPKSISIGKTVTIKGICTGYNYDAEMGIPGDVILTRCLIII
ncbi:MAG: hypothetical protein WCG67_08500 [Ferruginibacter sp.]